jgi:hypothetical protein
MPQIVDGFGRQRQSLPPRLGGLTAGNSHTGRSGGAVTTLVFWICNMNY